MRSPGMNERFILRHERCLSIFMPILLYFADLDHLLFSKGVIRMKPFGMPTFDSHDPGRTRTRVGLWVVAWSVAVSIGLGAGGCVPAPVDRPDDSNDRSSPSTAPGSDMRADEDTEPPSPRDTSTDRDRALRDASTSTNRDRAGESERDASPPLPRDVSRVDTGDASLSFAGDVNSSPDAGRDISGGSDAHSPSQPLTLKLAAWNLQTPSEGQTRTHYMARTAQSLNADVVALQEIGRNPSLHRIFPRQTYRTYVSRQPDNYLRTGFAVDRRLNVQRHGDYKPLAVDWGQRRGGDVTIQFRRHALRVLSLHLNAGCQQGNGPDDECRLLQRQARALKRWIEAREQADEDYLILGDFNRVYEAGSAFWRIIQRADRGMMVTSKGANPECHRDETYDQFIDHIVFDDDVQQWLDLSSFRELTYDRALSTDVSRRKVSDHCPVHVEVTGR